MPTERERTQWYFQRYVPHLPAAGEIVLMDRSWYNRAGVEHVMGYCTPRAVRMGPLARSWKRRSCSTSDTLNQLSPTDVEAISRWEDSSRAKDAMFDRTDTAHAPWYEVDNMIHHLLESIPWHPIEPPVIGFPTRPPATGYRRPPADERNLVPDHAATLTA